MSPSDRVVDRSRTELVRAAVRHIGRRWVTRYPAAYLPVARSRDADSVVSAKTEIVIDGFTRSAVTFSVIAFQLAQNDHVRVAHHLHAAAQLISGVQLGKPTLVTVRPPEPTILSAMVREPLVSAKQWLMFYAEFYDRILPLRDQVLVATFDEVTKDFGAVTDRVNERFGTLFRAFENSEANIAKCFTIIEERSQGPPWGVPLRKFLSGIISADQYFEATAEYRRERAQYWHEVPERRVPRPSLEREAIKEHLRSKFLAAPIADLRRRAEHAYAMFVT